MPRISVLDVAPDNLLVFDSLPPGGGACVSRMCWRGLGEQDHNEWKWEALRAIKLASCQHGISSSQHNRYAPDESY